MPTGRRNFTGKTICAPFFTTHEELQRVLGSGRREHTSSLSSTTSQQSISGLGFGRHELALEFWWGLAATNMPSLAYLVASDVWHHRPGLCKEEARHKRHHVVRVMGSGRQHLDARPVSDDAEVGHKEGFAVLFAAN